MNRRRARLPKRQEWIILPVTNSESEQSLAVEIRRKAMDLLARREHARRELARKLSDRFDDADPDRIGLVLDQLENDGLLSDRRYADSLVRMRRDRGYGPLYILSRLQSSGVGPDLVEEVLDRNDPDWVDVAEDVLRRKVGSRVISEEDPDKSKLLRFLASRGFTGEQSFAAWDRVTSG